MESTLQLQSKMQPEIASTSQNNHPPHELLSIHEIDIQERLRYANNDNEKEDLDRLMASIVRYGLLQPILVDQNNVLLDGWRRKTAFSLLHKSEPDNPRWHHIPVYRRERLTESEYNEIELESNFQRRQFTWQETVIGVCKIHRIRQREAALKGETWTQAMTGELLGGYSKSYVSNCLTVEPFLQKDWKTGQHKHPNIADLESLTDAVRMLYVMKEDDALKELAKRTQLSGEGSGCWCCLCPQSSHRRGQHPDTPSSYRLRRRPSIRRRRDLASCG
jgi:hypothetical protein